MIKQLPDIKTERLLLNQLVASDIPRIVQYASNRKIANVTTNIPSPYTEQDAVYWINLAHQGLKRGTNAIFAIRLKPNREFVGGIGLTIERSSNRAELGYWLAEPFWNKGYMTEAARAVIEFSFAQLNLNKVTSSHFATNPASGKVMEKAGMRKEGALKEHIQKNGTYHTLILYGLTKQQYSG